MASLPEKRFWNRIRPKIKALGVTWHYKNQAGSVRGIPDVILCIRGRFVALELKASRAKACGKTGRVVQQRHTLEQIQLAGGLAYFAYPENWETDIYPLLKALAR